MTFAALAKALRRRQLRLKLHPKQVIHATPDAAFVDAYTHCSACQRSIFPDTAEEIAAIRSCETAEQFTAHCTERLKAHNCPARHAPKN